MESMESGVIMTKEEAILLKDELLEYVIYVLRYHGGKDYEGVFAAALTILTQEFLG
ncbi:MAG: hypothetical protein LBG12_02780 [Synergistaceae bacterium]|jgi:hypothetical protein|nr:hypothetical protein [Synergistaceae bacterium]